MFDFFIEYSKLKYGIHYNASLLRLNDQFKNTIILITAVYLIIYLDLQFLTSYKKNLRICSEVFTSLFHAVE